MVKLDSTQPLGLPEGSVRAVLVLMLVGVFLYLCVTGGKIPETLDELVKWGAGGYGLMRIGTRMLNAPPPTSSSPTKLPPELEAI